MKNYSRKAMKMIDTNKAGLSASLELNLIRGLAHENVLKYYDNFETIFMGSECLCLIIEFCEVKFFFYQIFFGAFKTNGKCSLKERRLASAN